MKGRIPIHEKDRLVATIVWDGNRASGEWRIMANKKLDELRQHRVRRQIQMVYEGRRDLEERRWRDDIGVKRRGWHGFAGVLGAFETALPAIGFSVDRNRVTWPRETDLTLTPNDYDWEREEELWEFDQKEIETQDLWDLEAFNERNPG